MRVVRGAYFWQFGSIASLPTETTDGEILVAFLAQTWPQIAIPEGQNFRQKLQALAVIKIQISIHQKKALSELCRTITVGGCELYLCGSYLRFYFFPYKLQLNEN